MIIDMEISSLCDYEGNIIIPRIITREELNYFITDIPNHYFCMACDYLEMLEDLNTEHAKIRNYNIVDNTYHNKDIMVLAESFAEQFLKSDHTINFTDIYQNGNGVQQHILGQEISLFCAKKSVANINFNSSISVINNTEKLLSALENLNEEHFALGFNQYISLSKQYMFSHRDTYIDLLQDHEVLNAIANGSKNSSKLSVINFVQSRIITGSKLKP